jgi:hypothetical protein
MEVGFVAVSKKKSLDGKDAGGVFSSQQPFAAAAAAAAAPDDSAMLICAGISENSASAVKLSMKHLQEAINLIPESEKRGLSRAMSRFPHFVADEDNEEDLIVAEYLKWFLQAEDYNVWAASRRVAKYWETRIRAYPIQCYLNFPLPLLRSERTKIDNIFNSDYRDKQGRKLLIFRSSAILSSSTVSLSKISLERLLFYELSNIAANDKSARTLGLVVVAYLPNNEQDISIIIQNISALHGICASLPIRISCVHFITPVEQPAQARTAKETLVPYIAKCMREVCGSSKTSSPTVMANPHQNHIGPTDMVKTEIEKYGIPVDLVWDVITEGFDSATASNGSSETLDSPSATTPPSSNLKASKLEQVDASKQPNQTPSTTRNTSSSLGNSTKDPTEYGYRLQLVQNALSRYNAEISKTMSQASDTGPHPNNDLRRLYHAKTEGREHNTFGSTKRPRTSEPARFVKVLKDK